jgi:hypothetical protein
MNVALRNIRHEQPIGHPLLEILEHAGLAIWLCVNAISACPSITVKVARPH